MRRRFKLPQRRCRSSLKKKNSPGQRRISVLGTPTGGNHSTCGFAHEPLQPALRGRLSPAMFQQTAPDAEYVCPQGSALVLGKKSGGLGLRHTGFVGYWAACLPRRAALRRASVLLKLSANHCFLVGIRLVPAGVPYTFQNCGPFLAAKPLVCRPAPDGKSRRGIHPQFWSRMLNRQVRPQIRRLPHAPFLLPLYQETPRMPPHCLRISLKFQRERPHLPLKFKGSGPTCRSMDAVFAARLATRLDSRAVPVSGVRLTLFTQTTMERSSCRIAPPGAVDFFCTSWSHAPAGG